MKEVLVVHGGDCFATHEEYLDFLRNWQVDLTDGQHKGWKSTLMQKLGAGYNVTLPRFPNAQNAHYEEWKIMFEKYVPLMPSDSILIGHSLGGSFLTKYLSENRVPFSIRATILLAAPFDIDGDRALVEFTTDSLTLFAEQGGDIHLFHSEDDMVVPFTELAKYTKALPKAVSHIFRDRGHFNQEEFSELVDLVRSF